MHAQQRVLHQKTLKKSCIQNFLAQKNLEMFNSVAILAQAGGRSQVLLLRKLRPAPQLFKNTF